MSLPHAQRTHHSKPTQGSQTEPLNTNARVVPVGKTTQLHTNICVSGRAGRSELNKPYHIRKAPDNCVKEQAGTWQDATVGSVECCSADIQGCHFLRTTSIWVLRAAELLVDVNETCLLVDHCDYITKSLILLPLFWSRSNASILFSRYTAFTDADHTNLFVFCHRSQWTNLAGTQLHHAT